MCGKCRISVVKHFVNLKTKPTREVKEVLRNRDQADQKLEKVWLNAIWGKIDHITRKNTRVFQALPEARGKVFSPQCTGMLTFSFKDSIIEVSKNGAKLLQDRDRKGHYAWENQKAKRPGGIPFILSKGFLKKAKGGFMPQGKGIFNDFIENTQRGRPW